MGGSGGVQSVGATAEMMEPGASLQLTAKDGFLSSERKGKKHKHRNGNGISQTESFYFTLSRSSDDFLPPALCIHKTPV